MPRPPHNRRRLEDVFPTLRGRVAPDEDPGVDKEGALDVLLNQGLLPYNPYRQTSRQFRDGIQAWYRSRPCSPSMCGALEYIDISYLSENESLDDQYRNIDALLGDLNIVFGDPQYHIRRYYLVGFTFTNQSDDGEAGAAEDPDGEGEDEHVYWLDEVVVDANMDFENILDKILEEAKRVNGAERVLKHAIVYSIDDEMGICSTPARGTAGPSKPIHEYCAALWKEV